MAGEIAAALAADDEPLEQILLLWASADIATCIHDVHHLLICLCVDDCGMVVRDFDHLVACPRTVQAGIERIAQDLGHVAGEQLPFFAAENAGSAHLLDDGCELEIVQNALIELADVVCLKLDDLIIAIGVGGVAQRVDAAGVLTGADPDAAALDDLGGEVLGIILGETLHERLEEHSLVSLAKVLGDSNQARAALFDFLLIDGCVVTVAGEAILLVDEHQIDGAGFEICDHAQEVGAIVGSAGDRAIIIHAHNNDTVACSPFPDGHFLGFDGGIILTI